MKKMTVMNLSLSLALLVSFSALAATDSLKPVSVKIDTAQSSVEWEGRKVVGPHNGTLKLKDSTVEFKGDQLVGGKIEIDMKSIQNEDVKDPKYNKQLVDHLKGDDFFSVDKFPVATLAIKETKPGKNGMHDVTGDLTIKGITHPVTFPAKFEKTGSLAKAEGELVIDRTKWNVKYNSGKFFDVKALGDKVINDEFKVRFKVAANLPETKAKK